MDDRLLTLIICYSRLVNNGLLLLRTKRMEDKLAVAADCGHTHIHGDRKSIIYVGLTSTCHFHGSRWSLPVLGTTRLVGQSKWAAVRTATLSQIWDNIYIPTQATCVAVAVLRSNRPIVASRRCPYSQLTTSAWLWHWERNPRLRSSICRYSLFSHSLVHRRIKTTYYRI